ncbi:MAG: hypothetical protein EXS09_10305 [Gemmataceae bacterium]|nr:hypothetical protein [Gemmataceae bacterium]
MRHPSTEESNYVGIIDIRSESTLLHLFGLDAKKLVYARKNRVLSLLDGQAESGVTEFLW